ncbi:MAG: SigE family RNA polymerase sigma factor [Acidothermaceae bacterium]
MGADAEEQFRQFVEARWEPLRRFAYALTGDLGHAEDLLQTALISCHRRWGHIRAANPEAYVRRAVVNLNTSWWRRRRLVEYPTMTLPDVETPDATSRFDTRDEIWAAILALPNQMRAVLVLRYLEDLPEAEVAVILGCSLGAVKSQTSRGLSRLRSVLQTASDHLLPTEVHDDTRS